MNPCPSSTANVAMANLLELIYSDSAQPAISRGGAVTTQRILLQDGAFYSVTLSLLAAGALSGDIFRIIVIFEVSLAPTFNLYDDALGVILTTIAGTGYAFQSEIECTFNGVNWDLDVQTA